jgi:hypothetical protein
MKDDLIISIIQQEWPLFNKTQNVGHRSFCQNQMANFIVSRHAYWSMYSTERSKPYHIQVWIYDGLHSSR